MKVLCLIVGIVTYIAGIALGFTIKTGASWLIFFAALALGSVLLGLWKVISLLEKKNG